MFNQRSNYLTLIIDPKNTTITCTRYGNVMASRGSVIPLFVEKILNNEPLTVTNPKMTRFLMNLDEAVELVLFAFENANQGDLFVQKAPASTIIDLAEALKQTFNSDVPIDIIGTRHGEKNHETLLTKEERSVATDLDNYFQVPADTRDLNYEKYFDEGDIQEVKYTAYSSKNTDRLNVEQTIEKIKTTEYIASLLAKTGI